jgi:hypothetical protein
LDIDGSKSLRTVNYSNKELNEVRIYELKIFRGEKGYLFTISIVSKQVWLLLPKCLLSPSNATNLLTEPNRI